MLVFQWSTGIDGTVLMVDSMWMANDKARRRGGL
ncbi:hypothetical protein BOSE62_130133 [Bosea sp. 62]|nr:hypothetical protein BOSE7B_120135 [Bosea sp. 7B]CAD5279962.1 hypothetical protein BOSE21B_30781 [Bosea sp. 21B]CAD5281091.1 hypothetical protein BOSE46_40418 [Bosea sp. 46]VVT59481.1 hypothetical protein BOS5A_210272 [Bosea sp. EC-HK365B]VXB30593.1 hypothetical protein BOSE62_130133 [Bosea sp. 62]VXB92950.1 hypothetical protein BOSE127_160165 [Bosea sp. 127]VXC35726.1 hypothetical protein BOSE29B_30745 [Bosea sp. 29B]VXC81243.1 hypothetical protein BOSE125_50419 [Bosea sp. 125]